MTDMTDKNANINPDYFSLFKILKNKKLQKISLDSFRKRILSGLSVNLSS
jgi:hypothetical protein